MPLPEIAALLRSALGPAAAKVPSRILPDVLVRALGRVVPAMRSVATDIGRVKEPVIDRAVSVLGYAPRPVREAITDAAESMIRAGLAG